MLSHISNWASRRPGRRARASRRSCRLERLEGRRLLAAGSAGDLDLSFGSSGLVTTDFQQNGDSRAEVVLVQGDGRLVAAGCAGCTTSQHGRRHRSERGLGARHFEDQLGHRNRIAQVAPIPLDRMRVGLRECVEMGVGVVHEQPARSVVVEAVHIADHRLEIAQPVRLEVEFVDHRHRPNHRMVAVADVEPGAQVGHGRSATADIVTSFEQQGVDAGSSQVRSADQPVVTRTDHDHFSGDISVHDANLLALQTPNGRLWNSL